MDDKTRIRSGRGTEKTLVLPDSKVKKTFFSIFELRHLIMRFFGINETISQISDFRTEDHQSVIYWDYKESFL